MEDRQVGGSGFPGQHWDKEMEIVKSWRGTGLGEFTITFIPLYTVKHFFFFCNEFMLQFNGQQLKWRAQLRASKGVGDGKSLDLGPAGAGKGRRKQDSLPTGTS